MLRSVVEEGRGADREDLLRKTARFFGRAWLGAEIREALTVGIDGLITTGESIESEGGLMPAEAFELRRCSRSAPAPEAAVPASASSTASVLNTPALTTCRGP